MSSNSSGPWAERFLLFLLGVTLTGVVSMYAFTERIVRMEEQVRQGNKERAEDRDERIALRTTIERLDRTLTTLQTEIGLTRQDRANRQNGHHQ